MEITICSVSWQRYRRFFTTDANLSFIILQCIQTFYGMNEVINTHLFVFSTIRIINCKRIIRKYGSKTLIYVSRCWIGVTRRAKWAMPPQISSIFCHFCFERRYPKQSSVVIINTTAKANDTTDILQTFR